VGVVMAQVKYATEQVKSFGVEKGKDPWI